jgi:hypothetical protein
MDEAPRTAAVPPDQGVKKQKHKKTIKSEDKTSFAWDIAQDTPIAKRIPLKEAAVETATAHVTQLADLLEQYSNDDNLPSALKAALNTWIVEAGKLST